MTKLIRSVSALALALLLGLSVLSGLAENPAETAGPTGTSSPTVTPAPTETATPTETAEPMETAAPTETAEPTETAAPTETPAPTETATPAGTPEPVARDISKECFFNGQSGRSHNLTDGNYAKIFKTGAKDHARALRITTPEGEVAGAIYIQWNTLPLPLNIQTRTPEGEWVTVAECDGDFYNQYCPIPNLSDFRIVCRDDPMERLSIAELKVLTPGTPPEGIQVWQKPGDKVDLMLLVGHPDDELLWFGGLLPYYGGELEKNVLVIVAAMNRPLRRLELCDALWACGVRTHPVHVVRYDFSTTDMHAVLSKWGGQEHMKEVYTEYIRKYKPDVLVLQDVYGEYGHGIHKAVSWLGRECAELASDPSVYPEQAEQWGTWDVPKIYIHLYPEEQMQMNWDLPLKNFGGKTAMEVAQEAMLFHKSQTEHGWAVTAGGEMDNSLFGLYRTLVGPDEEKNDFFEHIASPEGTPEISPELTPEPSPEPSSEPSPEQPPEFTPEPSPESSPEKAD